MSASDRFDFNTTKLEILIKNIQNASPKLQLQLSRAIAKTALKEEQDKIKAWASSHKKTGRLAKSVSTVRVKKVKTGQHAGEDIAFVHFKKDKSKTTAWKGTKRLKPQPARIALWLSSGTKPHVNRSPHTFLKKYIFKKKTKTENGISGDNFLNNIKKEASTSFQESYTKQLANTLEQFLAQVDKK